MKVLLYSHFFSPSVGGVETVSQSLAEGFIENNIQCKIITTTEGSLDKTDTYEVIRNPNKTVQRKLVQWADVILYNGISLSLVHWVILYNKPFIWVHVGYQASSIDGLGWVDGQPAPLHPIASVYFHYKLKGIKWAFVQGSKLLLKRLIAKYIVNKNVAITDWMDKTQPFPNQIRIYNPFPLTRFQKKLFTIPEFDFLFLGRIVSEKGISTLLKALALLNKNSEKDYRLLLIGDGSWRQKMEELSSELKINNSVVFAGKKTGKDLIEWIAKGKIAIIPSEWLEPMGGVAIEFMAAEKTLIVSEMGGLKECVGDAGLTFPNGDFIKLAQCMHDLLQDDELCKKLANNGRERIRLFNPDLFINEYIKLLKSVC